MTDPRVRSGVRKVKGVTRENNVSHTGVTTPRSPAGHRDGYGMGRGRAEELPPLTERRAREFNWATQHLPDEHTGLVVSALISLELAKEKQTTKTVMARLEAQGRTAKQMGEKGWL
jgi:hypothetical protein